MPNIFSRRAVVESSDLRISLETISNTLIQFDETLRLQYNPMDNSYIINGSHNHTVEVIQNLFWEKRSSILMEIRIHQGPLSSNKRISLLRAHLSKKASTVA